MSVLRAVLSPCKLGKELVTYLLGSLRLFFFLSGKKGNILGEDEWNLFNFQKSMFFILFPRPGPHEMIASNGVLVVCVFPKIFFLSDS